jgi:hypothetical protein
MKKNELWRSNEEDDEDDVHDEQWREIERERERVTFAFFASSEGSSCSSSLRGWEVPRFLFLVVVVVVVIIIGDTTSSCSLLLLLLLLLLEDKWEEEEEVLFFVVVSLSSWLLVFSLPSFSCSCFNCFAWDLRILVLPGLLLLLDIEYPHNLIYLFFFLFFFFFFASKATTMSNECVNSTSNYPNNKPNRKLPSERRWE